MDIERRFTTGLELRRVNGKARLEGLAVPYDTVSEDMGFRETIAGGALSAHLRSDPDVRALVEHDSSKIVGRTRSGTLQLIEADDGVRVSIEPPDSQTGNDLVESVRRGDLSAMSFGFRALNDNWSTVNGEPLRTVTEAELFDVSIVAYPSYPDTSIAVRSLDRWRKETKPMETKTIEPQETKTEPTVTTPVETPEPKPERRSIPAEPKQAIPTVASTDASPEWRNHATGVELRVLNREQKFTDLHRSEEPLSLGRMVRALVVGDWTGAEAEQRALSTTANPTAGILVPNPMAARVIDLARARSVLARAGAKTVSMDASTLTIARVSGDATMAVKAENATFTASDVSFDAIEMTAYTIGTLVKMSRELAADAPNAVSLIENTIAAKLAERIDFFGLQGSGSAQPLGLLNFAGTGTEAVGGAVDYDNILNGMVDVEGANHSPNAYLVSPTNVNGLRQLKVNAEANHYATAPAAVSRLTGLVTGNMPDTTMVVGDFSQFLIGLRQSPTIEVTTEGGASFEEHAVYVKITWRGAFNVEHLDAFSLLTGIS